MYQILNIRCTRCIKSEHLLQGRINNLAEWLGEIGKLAEHVFNERKKILFEACKQGCVWNLIEVTKIANISEIKKKNKQRSNRDAEKGRKM